MSELAIPDTEQRNGPRRVFTFLVFYRWLSLIPPLVTLFSLGETRLAFTLLAAAAVNGLISLFARQLNQALRTRPWLLAVDLCLMAVLVAFSGGWRSPYYLHALSPLLAAAFFFQWRGALVATTGFLPLYSVAVVAAATLSSDSLDWSAIVTAIVGFYLISGVFGYASGLVARLRSARDRLAQAHRDLGVIHDLTVSLQSAADVEEVQERVLEAVIGNLGFKRAVVGLVDQDRGIINGWLGRARNEQMISAGGLPHLMPVPLSAQGGPVAEALAAQQVRQVTSSPGTADGWILAHFGISACLIFPMLLREHPVGVLLVDTSASREDPERLRSLENIASQAAVAIGTTMLCINRAQRLAVQEERLRIAQDIHDTVSQSLFGIVYTLDGSLKLLPEQPEIAVPELERVLRVAQATHNEVRQSILNIWPSEMTAERFVAGLRKYAADFCRADDLQLDFDVRGDFTRLSSQARRSLYRIAQEALNNVVHHAAATRATVCMAVAAGRAWLVVQDNGRGFDPDIALSREASHEHFGLKGMQQRADALGGACEFCSQPGAGASVLVDVPAGFPGDHA